MMIFESTPKQRQKIGFLRKLLKMSDDIYYEIIYADYGVNSSKELSYKQADSLIRKFTDKAVAAGVYDPKKSNYTRYNNLSGRQGMATPAQLRKIDVMWNFISFQPTAELRRNALNAFIKRITGKERVNFLTQYDVRKVIKAIETMEHQAAIRANAGI